MIVEAKIRISHAHLWRTVDPGKNVKQKPNLTSLPLWLMKIDKQILKKKITCKLNPVSE